MTKLKVVVIPAKAGIQCFIDILDSRFRGNDNNNEIPPPRRSKKRVIHLPEVATLRGFFLATQKSDYKTPHLLTSPKTAIQAVFLFIQPQRRQKRALRNLHIPNFPHFFLPLFLLIQKFSLPRNISAVAFRSHVFPHR